MAWLKLYQTLPKNKKTIRLKRLLKIKTPQAIGHLCLLWLWALDNAEDGDLSCFSDEEIAEVCEFSKNSENFVKSLIESEFLTSDKKIHNWDEYAGKLIADRESKREQDRVRQQRCRSKQKADGDTVMRDDIGCERDGHINVTRDISVSHALRVDKSRVDKSRVDNESTESTPLAHEEPAQEDQKQTKTVKSAKVKYAEFVSMTEDEHGKLVSAYGELDTNRLIEILNRYKGSTGKKYKSDYLTILNWVVDRLNEEKAKKGGRQNARPSEFKPSTGFRSQ